MPIYDYRCDHCQATFEVRATFQEKEHGLKPMCINCHSTETHQVVSAGMFVHKGTLDSALVSSTCCGPDSKTGCCG